MAQLGQRAADLLVAPAAAEDAAQIRTSPSVLRVRARPDTDATIVGRLAADEPFEVWAWGQTSRRCPTLGWAQVARAGWSCMDGTVEAERAPAPLPRMLAFDPPRPEESSAYFKTGTWPRDDAGEPPILPFIYGKRWMRWAGPEYEDLAAFEAGMPLRPLGGFLKYHFTSFIETDRGTVLTRRNGHVVPLDGVHVYPTTRFGGVDLSVDPPPAQAVAAWAVATRGVDVRAFPSDDAEVSWQAPFHHRLWLAQDDGSFPRGWVRIIDATNTHPGGWVRTTDAIRRWVHAPPPDDAGDSLWIDVDLQQQMLAVRRGDLPIYVTLVSTGASGHETPTGLYRIFDKAAWWDMASLPESTQPYHLEAVPWVMHFYPRYALHGAFWHNRFGHVVSHGCINLAPRDARVIFHAVQPELPRGWWMSNETADDPGTLLRVRAGTAPVVDRRRGI